MKPAPFATRLLGLFLLAATAHGSDFLRVQDPQSWWKNGQGTIEKSVLTVRPAGINMEYGLYLTFSANGLGYSHSDTFEVQFEFDLPAGSVVHDSWLWIGDTIIRGDLIDKWTAASIYEDIVNRRRDPSILYKRSETHYELRIFPMAGDEMRKIKISYLVPGLWDSRHVVAPLPSNLIRTSRTPVQGLSVVTWPDNEWKNPSIPELEGSAFATSYDSTLGTHERLDISWGDLARNPDIAFDSPLTDGLYVNHSGDGTGGAYQLALLPSRALNLSAPRKAALLFDYESGNSSITPPEAVEAARSALISTFTTRDSFNVILSQVNIRRMSDRWLPADSATVDSVFSILGPDPLASYSNLPALLANGVEFVNANGADGGLLLFSNSDQVGAAVPGNQLIADLRALMTNPVTITVVDYQSQDFTYHYIGNQYFYGNAYFYTNITRVTGGDYFAVRPTGPYGEFVGLATVAPLAMQSLGGFLGSFDLYTRVQGGFCYSRLNASGEGTVAYLDRTILQTGRYYGDFPLTVELSGVFGGQVFNQQFVLDDTTSAGNDSLCAEIWAGNYVRYLEGQSQTNDVTSDIVRISVDERVLSEYSAFICLEPSRGGEVCYDCLDESGSIVGVEDSADAPAGDSLLVAFPNPFNSSTTIRVTVPAGVGRGEVSLKIYDVLGREVRDFDLGAGSAGRPTDVVWNGDNGEGAAVNSGVYFVVFRTPEKVRTVKLMMLK